MNQPSPPGARRALVVVPSVAGVLALAVVSLWPALRGEFTSHRDQRDVLENPAVAAASRGELAAVFRLEDARNAGGYRVTPFAPLADLSSALDLAIWGERSAGHHATGAALFLATAALLFVLVRRTTGSDAAAVAAAGLLAVHPLATGTAAWIGGRPFVLAGALVLASLVVRTTPASARRWVGPLSLAGSVALFALALLADVRVAPLALLLALRRPEDRAAGDLRGRGLFEGALFVLPAAGLLAVSLVVAPGPSWPRFGRGIAGSLTADLSAAGWAVQSFLLPARLVPMADVPVGSEAAPYLVLGSLALLAGLAAGFRLAIGRGGPACLGLAGAALALAGQSASIFPVESRADFGQAYLASVFLTMAVAALAARSIVSLSIRQRVVLASAGAFAAAALCGLSIRSNGRWHDSEALWKSVLAVDAAHPIAHSKLGELLLADADARDEAFRHLETGALGTGRSLAIDPVARCLVLSEYANVYQGTPAARRWIGTAAERLEEAESEGVYDRSGHLARYWRYWIEVSRGDLALAAGELEPAEAHFRSAIREHPRASRARRGLAHVHVARGEPERALEILDQALLDDPHDDDARISRAQLLFNLGRVGDADEAFAQVAARTADPDLLVEALYGRSSVLLTKKPGTYPGEARRLLERAASIGGVRTARRKLSEVHVLLADFAIVEREWNAAIEHLDRALSAWPGNVPARVKLAETWREIGRKEYAQLVADFRSEFFARAGVESGSHPPPDDYSLFFVLAPNNPRLLDRLQRSIERFVRAYSVLEKAPEPEPLAGLKREIGSLLALLLEVKAGVLLNLAPDRPALAKAAHDDAIAHDAANAFANLFLRDYKTITGDGVDAHDEFHQLVRTMEQAGDFEAVRREYAKLRESLARSPDHLKLLLLEEAGVYGRWIPDFKARRDAAGRFKRTDEIVYWTREMKKALEDSVRCYQAVLEIDPGHEMAHRNLAVTYSNVPDWDRAIHHYEFLANTGFMTDEDRESLATLYLNRGSRDARRAADDRIEDLERHLELAATPGTSARVLLWRLRAARSMGGGWIAEALADLGPLLKEAPFDPEGNRMAGRAWLAIGALEETAIRMASIPSAVSFDVRGRSLAIDHLERVVRTRDVILEDLMIVARAYRSGGRYYDAYLRYTAYLQGLDRLLEEERPAGWRPDAQEARTFQGHCTRRYVELFQAGDEARLEGKWEAAVSLFREAVRYNADRPEGLLGLATSCLGAERFTDFEIALKNLLLRHPDDPDGLYLAGMYAWNRLHDAGASRKLLERYLTAHPEGRHVETVRRVLETLPPPEPPGEERK